MVASATRISANDGENVVLTHDEVLVPVDLHLGARVLAHEDLVALLDLERHALAVLGDPAGARRDDLALLRLLLGGVRDDDPAALHFGLVQAADENAVS